MNIIKKNEVLNPLFNNTKIFFENDVIEITHYKKIKLISLTEIQLKEIIICGQNLKVIFIDKYLIRISGNIDIVKRGIINE